MMHGLKADDYQEAIPPTSGGIPKTEGVERLCGNQSPRTCSPTYPESNKKFLHPAAQFMNY